MPWEREIYVGLFKPIKKENERFLTENEKWCE